MVVQVVRLDTIISCYPTKPKVQNYWDKGSNLIMKMVMKTMGMISMIMLFIPILIMKIMFMILLFVKVEDGWKASKMMSRAQSSVTANYTVMCQSGPRRKYQGKLTLIKVGGLSHY